MVAAFLILASCSKTKVPVSEKMNGIEFTAKYKLELPYLDYSNGTARVAGKKAKASEVTFTVTEDLILSGSVSCATSPNAEWGGIQKFLALPLSNDGAVSYCNFNWSYTIPAPSMNCPTSTSGVYRGWTSDHDYSVHLSNLVIIP